MAVAATAIWRARPGGNNANGGGFDAAISGAGTDYSQQDAAQVSGTAGTASGTTAFSDAAGLFTAAMVGNAIRIASGAGFTAGWYFVTGYTSATAVTLDRSPGTGSAAVWKLGGGWADPGTNLSVMVPGNVLYVLGSGIPNPASYVYDYSVTAANVPAGDATNGFIRIANDPMTPNYGNGGMPCIQGNGRLYVVNSYNIIDGLYFVANGAAYSGVSFIGVGSYSWVVNCVIDQFGYAITGPYSLNAMGNEIFSSLPGSPSSTASGIYQSGGTVAIGNNIHDYYGDGISCTYQSGIVSKNIIAKCSNRGIAVIATGGNYYRGPITENTIDGNGGSGIEFSINAGLPVTQCYNNIISGHISAGKYGLSVLSGSPALNSRTAPLFDYNVFYNNSSNYNGINAGPHDTALAADPYVDSAHNDYTLK